MKIETEHNKGKIKHNALRALVKSSVFKYKLFKNKKCYNRKQKHRNKESDSF